MTYFMWLHELLAVGNVKLCTYGFLNDVYMQMSPAQRYTLVEIICEVKEYN